MLLATPGPGEARWQDPSWDSYRGCLKILRKFLGCLYDHRFNVYGWGMTSLPSSDAKNNSWRTSQRYHIDPCLLRFGGREGLQFTEGLASIYCALHRDQKCMNISISSYEIGTIIVSFPRWENRPRGVRKLTHASSKGGRLTLITHSSTPEFKMCALHDTSEL